MRSPVGKASREQHHRTAWHLSNPPTTPLLLVFPPCPRGLHFLLILQVAGLFILSRGFLPSALASTPSSPQPTSSWPSPNPSPPPSPPPSLPPLPPHSLCVRSAWRLSHVLGAPTRPLHAVNEAHPAGGLSFILCPCSLFPTLSAYQELLASHVPGAPTLAV